MTSANSVCGLLLVDKPAGPTSHNIVSRVKKILGVSSVGHLGTLDPFASGLLPVLIGGATRLADDIMEGAKTYLFKVTFGKETDTLDGTGRVVDEKEVPENFALLLPDVLSKFMGDIEQVPPVYSALKMNGMPLYEHMRGTGKLPFDIESKRRIVHIHSLEIVKFEVVDDVRSAVIRVHCGKGTYVRSLARDLAKAIGTVGTCTELRREGVEPWHVHGSIVIERDIPTTAEEILSRIVPPMDMIKDLMCFECDTSERRFLLAGNPFYIDQVAWEARVGRAQTPAKLFVKQDDLLFLGETHSDGQRVKIQPRKKIM